MTGRTDGHKPCPFCEFGLIFGESDNERPRICYDCDGSGQAITWGARAQRTGGHFTVSLWAGRKGSRANLGNLTMSPDDWSAFQLQGQRMLPPLDVTLWCLDEGCEGPIAEPCEHWLTFMGQDA